MREPWEPDLDSLAIVDVILEIEEVVDFDIPPEKVIRKGGYMTTDEAVQDIAGRLQRQWDRHH